MNLLIIFNTLKNVQVNIILTGLEVNMCNNLNEKKITIKQIVNNNVIDLLQQYINICSHSIYR